RRGPGGREEGDEQHEATGGQRRSRSHRLSYAARRMPVPGFGRHPSSLARPRSSLVAGGPGPDHSTMPSSTTSSPSRVSPADLALLVYLGAVWGAAFLCFRVASPEIGPLWTAEIRVAIAGLVLALVSGRAALAAARRQPAAFLIVGATFSAIPFSLLAFATLSLPASLASPLMATTPRFTALGSPALLRPK